MRSSSASSTRRMPSGPGSERKTSAPEGRAPFCRRAALCSAAALCWSMAAAAASIGERPYQSSSGWKSRRCRTSRHRSSDRPASRRCVPRPRSDRRGARRRHQAPRACGRDEARRARAAGRPPGGRLRDRRCRRAAGVRPRPRSAPARSGADWAGAADRAGDGCPTPAGRDRAARGPRRRPAPPRARSDRR